MSDININAEGVWQVYQQHKINTESFLSNLGDDPVVRNAAITNVYSALSKQAPAFLWLSLGTLVSGTVGKNIALTGKIDGGSAGQLEAANVIYNAFSRGNQDIFKNIIPLYLTYQDVDITGIQVIENSKLKGEFASNEVYSAFHNYHSLQETQQQIADTMELEVNDPKVVKALFSDDGNIELAKSIGIDVTSHEQQKAQPLYNDSVTKILTDPILGMGGDLLQLGGIKITGQYYSMLDYIDNPAELEQRMLFADILLNNVGLAASDPALFSMYQSEVRMSAAYTLWMANPHVHNLDGENGLFWAKKAETFDTEFLEKIDAFLDTHYDVNQKAEQTVMDEPEPTPENYLVTFDFSENQWRDISEFEVTKNPNGIWISPDTYPEAMNLVAGYPLIDASIYHDAGSNQSYLFCTADFLPNLPPNYMWLSLKTYMEPSETGGYKNGGSLWIAQGLGNNVSAEHNHLTLEDVLDVPKDLIEKHLNSTTKNMSLQHNEIVALDSNDVLCPEACCLSSESMLFPEQVIEFY